MIGDLLCTTPMMRAIKKNNPNVKLTVCVNTYTENVLKNNPHVDKILVIDRQINYNLVQIIKLIARITQFKFDCCFIANDEQEWIAISLLAGIPLRVGIRPPIPHTFQKYFGRLLTDEVVIKFGENSSLARIRLLNILDIHSDDIDPEIYWEKINIMKVNDYFTLKKISILYPMIAITPKTGVSFKDWDEMRWVDVADKLSKHFKTKIFFLGSHKDESAIKSIQERMKYPSYSVAGQFSINELAYFLSKCNLHISSDTGPLFVASAVKIPCVVLAGPNPRSNLNHLTNVEIISKDLSCYPCHYVFQTTDKCMNEFSPFACKTETSVDDVFNAAVQVLAKFNAHIHKNDTGY